MEIIYTVGDNPDKIRVFPGFLGLIHRLNHRFCGLVKHLFRGTLQGFYA